MKTTPSSSFGELTLEDVYRRYGHVVRRRATQILGSVEQGEEVLQELFSHWSHQMPAFEARSSLTTWLYRVTTNACLNRLRDERNRAQLIRLHVTSPDSDGGELIGENTSLLRTLLARFPREQAEVAVLYFMDEMTHAEIAETLGVSRRHVGNLLARFHENAARHRETS